MGMMIGYRHTAQFKNKAKALTVYRLKDKSERPKIRTVKTAFMTYYEVSWNEITTDQQLF